MTPVRFLSLAFRILAIVVILVAPWLEPIRRPSHAHSVVYVVDRSASVGHEGLALANLFLSEVWPRRGDARLGVVAFDGAAEVVAPLGARQAPTIEEGKDTQSSDLASAIRLAHATLPREGYRSIVLMTDARPTRGDAEAEVGRAADHGIRVDVVPISGGTPPLPVVTSIKPRSSHVAEHQPVVFDVDVLSDGPFLLRWTRDGTSLPPRRVYKRRQVADSGDPDQNQASVEPVELHDPTPPPGIHVYEVRAMPAHKQGGAEESPSVLTAVDVEGRAQAAVFSSAGEVPPVLKTALDEVGLEGRALPIERAADPSSYAGADLVVLSDVRVSASKTDDSGLTHAAQSALVDHVQQGGGLLVTGGVFGFAPEYAGTPLARVLPVEIEDRGHVEDPPVALAIMLDRSGSMSAPVGGGSHTKIELAIEASLAAADVLRTTDQVAIGSVDTETHWDVPLGPVDRVSDLRASVRRVEAGGGGIYVYTALKDAYTALAKVRYPIRHVILFSDTSDSEEQFKDCPFDPCSGRHTAEALAHEARVKGITTTVVGIGEEEAPHTPFLRRVAAEAGGRFYITSEGADLRRIFLSETRVLAQSNLREKKTTVRRAGPHPALEGVDPATLPILSAYVETNPRPGADTALLLDDAARPEGRPLLATWRYGLGKVGAIATDFSQGWGAAWASSPTSAQLLKQTVRFLLRQHEAHRADAQVRMRDRVVEVDIELPPDAPESAAPRSVEVHAIEKSGASRKLAMRLEQRGPGRYRARGYTSGEPIVIARALGAHGSLMAEAVGREDRTVEISGTGADAHLVSDLARRGDGRVNPQPLETLSDTHFAARQLEATWPYALIAAAVLVVLDLVLRRFARRRDTARVTAAAILAASS